MKESEVWSYPAFETICEELKKEDVLAENHGLEKLSKPVRLIRLLDAWIDRSPDEIVNLSSLSDAVGYAESTVEKKMRADVRFERVVGYDDPSWKLSTYGKQVRADRERSKHVPPITYPSCRRRHHFLSEIEEDTGWIGRHDADGEWA